MWRHIFFLCWRPSYSFSFIFYARPLEHFFLQFCVYKLTLLFFGIKISSYSVILENTEISQYGLFLFLLLFWQHSVIQKKSIDAFLLHLETSRYDGGKVKKKITVETRAIHTDWVFLCACLVCLRYLYRFNQLRICFF
jgi:hypothetical protein